MLSENLQYRSFSAFISPLQLPGSVDVSLLAVYSVYRERRCVIHSQSCLVLFVTTGPCVGSRDLTSLAAPAVLLYHSPQLDSSDLSDMLLDIPPEVTLHIRMYMEQPCQHRVADSQPT